MATSRHVPPVPADVAAAAQRISGRVHHTPVLTSRRLDEACGAQVFLKCENFQRAGAFKARGAFNALLTLTPQERERGVIAYSSGNHAQAIALASRDLGVNATVVMPLDAPQMKIEATKGYGARVVPYDRYSQDREQIGRELAAQHGLTLIPPFDHPDIIAGQGTAAAELLAESGHLDALVVPLGGGGLLAGTILAAQARQVEPAGPAGDAGQGNHAGRTQVFGVEPATADDGRQSVEQGRIMRIDTPRTIADGVQTQALGELTFPIIAGGVADVLTVADDALAPVMRMAAQTLKIVIEPTAALPLAAVLDGQVTRALTAHGGRDLRIGVVLSGGNVDPGRYADLLRSEDAPKS